MTGLELICITLTVYYESRSEPTLGQVAVAQVVLARVASPDFPDTPCQVVYQSRQFSWHRSSTLADQETDERAWDKALLISKAVIAGSIHYPLVGILHYHKTTVDGFTFRPSWSYDFDPVLVIGAHVFLREKELIV